VIGAWWRGRSRRGRSRIAHFVAAFRAGLREAGFFEGQNVAIEFRSAENDLARSRLLSTRELRSSVAHP
jgi:hypothetical protein